jgi:hypothetical protein
MSLVDRTTKRTYIVSDYGGIEGEFEKLKDARKCLKEVGEGRFATITAKTVETITINTEKVIQSKFVPNYPFNL